MKIAVRVVPVLLLIGMLVSGCALFGSRHKGGAKTPGSQATARRQGGLTESTAGSTRMTAATTGSGPVSATNNSGTGVAEANTGARGTGAGPGGVGAGSGAGSETAPDGYSAFFYICVLLAAAVVAWVIWAIWHRYRARHGPVRPHPDHRPA